MIPCLNKDNDDDWFQVDVWRPPTRPGSAVDLRVSPGDFKILQKLFSKYKIRYKVQIPDIQTLINRQNDAHNDSLPWHSDYHTFEQVTVF